LERREPLGTYAAFNDSLGDPNAFRDPDDYLAFIGSHWPYLAADAWRCHQDHGRGMVLLKGPLGGAVGFIESWYVTMDPGDFDGFARPGLAREDCEQYDPAREILVGVTDPRESFLLFWRMARGEMTPPEAYEAVGRARSPAVVVPPPMGDAYTPPIKRRFW
jgi:hypothetical protein